jgi:hypothetical protein
MTEVQTNDNHHTKIQKVKLTWEEKKSICEQWKKSGKSQNTFCKEQGIAPQTFWTWCKKLWPKKQNQLTRVLVVDKKNLEQEEPIHTMIEIALPNNGIIRFSLPINKIASLMQEIFHANTIIR